MNSLSRRAVAVIVLSLGALVAGCSTQNPTDSSIPWNRPASWEGQVPGMGTTPGSNTH